MKKTLLILFGFFAFVANSQDKERITINGKIIVQTEDKEGVTVYNTSSNRGTTTEKDGYFKIDVALNDVVEFGALQFQDFKVVISEKIIASKRLTVILVEEVNKLDDVYFGLDHIEDFEFSADYKTKADNVAFNEYNPSVDNMLNLVNVAGFLLEQVVGVDMGKSKSEKEKQLERTPFKKALDAYSKNYIHSNFDIPLNKVESFIIYVEKEGLDKSLFKENKEMQLLERISQLSKSFLKEPSGKD